jgi:hypothetical protein
MEYGIEKVTYINQNGSNTDYFIPKTSPVAYYLRFRTETSFEKFY